MHINFIAVLVAAVVAFVLGSIWYTVLGKRWQAALGKTDEEIGKGGPGMPPIGALITSFVAELIMALVLAHLIAAAPMHGPVYGAAVGGVCWLGFVVTTIAVNNAYPGRKLALTVIDSAHWLLVLAAEGLVIGVFH